MPESDATQREGWKVREISRGTRPQPVDFSDFDPRLVGVGNYLRETLVDTPYGIGGAEDYSRNPRERTILGIFSVYASSHNNEGALVLKDVGNFSVLTNGNLSALIPDSRFNKTLEEKLLKIAITKNVTPQGKVIDKK